MPALRFKNDEEQNFPDWEEKKLGEISTFFSGGTPVTTNKEFYVGEIPFIKSGEIKKDKTAQFISEAGLKNSSAKMVLKGDLLYALYGATSGEVAISKIEGAINQAVLCIRSKLNTYFLMSYFLREKEDILQTYLQGGQGNLSAEIVKSLNVPVPSQDEQNKIANFLSAVDEKISQLTKKHELLNQYKKGVMQKIFSQKLRFKDDDGSEFSEWSHKLLGDLCSITTGKLDANAMVENGEYRFYTCAKEYYKIDKYAFDTEALLISGNGANVGYIHYYKGKFNAYQRTYVLNNFSENIIFIKYFLDAFLHVRIFKEAKEGNTPYIVMNTLTEMPVKIPSLREQSKIAEFLIAIDEKINQAQSQLELVKQYKQGLLQQMFV
jgi:type I restriction enzyme S subunit